MSTRSTFHSFVRSFIQADARRAPCYQPGPAFQTEQAALFFLLQNCGLAGRGRRENKAGRPTPAGCLPPSPLAPHALLALSGPPLTVCLPDSLPVHPAAPPKADVPVISSKELPDFDGFIICAPTRFGTMAAQVRTPSRIALLQREEGHKPVLAAGPVPLNGAARCVGPAWPTLAFEGECCRALLSAPPSAKLVLLLCRSPAVCFLMQLAQIVNT